MSMQNRYMSYQIFTIKRLLSSRLLICLSVSILLITATATHQAAASDSIPELIDPLPGTRLSAADFTLKWSANGYVAHQWYVRVGLSPNSTEFADVRITDPATQQLRVTGLPTNGESVFVQFSYKQSGSWTKRTFEYRASDSRADNVQSPADDEGTNNEADNSSSIPMDDISAEAAGPGKVQPFKSRLFEPVDISFNNPSWSGNPFDLLATAQFSHEQSATVRIGEFFYAGNDNWTVRFVADKTGTWTFNTQSSDRDLDNRTGTISVSDSQGTGFIVARGNKWAHSATGQAFVPQYVMAGTLSDFADDPGKITEDLNTFVDGHGFTGLHVRGYCQFFLIGTDSCRNISAAHSDPDFKAFEALENIITQTYDRGGSTHIWMYGDNSRGQNPTDWGLNGVEDQRMQRYFAARLGALPGWTLGYGYDIGEWASPSQIESWYSYLSERMMHPHLIGARGPKNVTAQHTNVLSYASFEQHHPNYDRYVEAISYRPSKPSFSEDRFRIDQAFAPKDYSFKETRRGMWHSAMAGGVANIWGNMQFDEGGSYDEGSRVYPNKNELKIYSDFMIPRFRSEFERCANYNDGLCLQLPSSAYFLVYKENTSRINLNLGDTTEPGRFTAMDTVTGRTTTGSFQAEQRTWSAPYAGDWIFEMVR